MSPSTTRPVPDIQTILSRFGEDFAICTRRLERCRKRQELAETMVLKFRASIRSLRVNDLHTRGKKSRVLSLKQLCVKIDRQQSKTRDPHKKAWLAGLKKSLVPPAIPEADREDYLNMTFERADAYLMQKASECGEEYVRVADTLDLEGHPFERVVLPWLVAKTAFTEAELRKAERLGFGGHKELVDRLRRVDCDGDTSRLWEILTDEKYQHVFERIGLGPGGGLGGRGPEKNGPRSSRVTTNVLMLDVLTKKPECRGWTISKWQAEIRRSRASIQGTETWKQLSAARRLMRAERATTSRRRKK